MAFPKLTFIKIGAFWRSPKKDKKRKSYWSGQVLEDMEMKKGERIFLFQVLRRSERAPELELSIGKEMPVEPEPIVEEPEVIETEVISDDIDEDDVPF